MRICYSLLIAHYSLFFVFPALAVPSFQSVQWGQGGGRSFQPLQSLPLNPGQKLKKHLRARVSLSDESGTEEGILLRYDVAAQIAPIGGRVDPVWAVPFLLDEWRIPKIAAKKPYQISLDPTERLSVYLKRLRLAGFWIRAIRLEIMVEPRQGESRNVPVMRSVLPVQ